MAFGDLDHVGVVVADLSEAENEYQQLGFSVLYRERIEEQGVDIVGLRAGDSSIELLKPISPDSALQRYLGDQRSRLHHLDYRVVGLENEIQLLLSLGVPMVEKQSRRGAEGKRNAFVHPTYTGATLVELC
jgi:methylmalonyl-CoA/ethylmalonyl-CoA epimerase